MRSQLELDCRSVMGAASYKLHNACPELNARYLNCQALVFENSLTPQTAKNADGTPAAPQVFRDGKVVTNAADVALTLDALNPSSVNYRCKMSWLDYTECVKVSGDVELLGSIGEQLSHSHSSVGCCVVFAGGDGGAQARLRPAESRGSRAESRRQIARESCFRFRSHSNSIQVLQKDAKWRWKEKRRKSERPQCALLALVRCVLVRCVLVRCVLLICER